MKQIREMERLSRKDIYEISKMYIGSQMAKIDGSNIGDLETHPQVGEIVREINRQGRIILGKRPCIGRPEDALKFVKKPIKLTYFNS